MLYITITRINRYKLVYDSRELYVESMRDEELPDIYKKIMWYSSDENFAANLTAVPVDRVTEIINLNEDGNVVENLIENDEKQFKDILNFDQMSDNERIKQIGKPKKDKKKQNKHSQKKKFNSAKFRPKK